MPTLRYRFPDRGNLNFASNADVLVASSVGIDRDTHDLTWRTALHVYHKARGCWADPLELPQLQRTSVIHLIAFVEPRLLLVVASERPDESPKSFHAHVLRASDAYDRFVHGWSRLLISFSGNARTISCGLYGTTSRLWFVLFDKPMYKAYDVDNVLDEKAEVRLKVPPFSLENSTMMSQCAPYGDFLYMLCRYYSGTFSTQLHVLNFATGSIMFLPEFLPETGRDFGSVHSRLRFAFFNDRLYGVLVLKNVIRLAVFDLKRRVWKTTKMFSLCTVPNIGYQFYRLSILPSGEVLVETTPRDHNSHTKYTVSTFIEPPTLLDLAYRIIHTRMPSYTRRLLGQSDVAKPHELVNALLGGISMSRKRMRSPNDTSEKV